MPLSAELTSWKEEHAVNAARLLRVCLLAVEEEAEAHVSTLLPAICKVKTVLPLWLIRLRQALAFAFHGIPAQNPSHERHFPCA